MLLTHFHSQLQLSDKAAGTKELTSSFGWDRWESALTQHDVQVCITGSTPLSCTYTRLTQKRRVTYMNQNKHTHAHRARIHIWFYPIRVGNTWHVHARAVRARLYLVLNLMMRNGWERGRNIFVLVCFALMLTELFFFFFFFFLVGNVACADGQARREDERHSCRGNYKSYVTTLCTEFCSCVCKFPFDLRFILTIISFIIVCALFWDSQH